MTCRQLYQWAKKALSAAGADPDGNDALLLAEHFFGLDRTGLALRGAEQPPEEREAAFRLAVEQRTQRRPLQYILGSWDFMGLTLAVGDGVLCPREDTAVLVEAMAERLKDRPAPKGLDLCAGTGAVALGLCSLLPGAEVVCAELSPLAFPYLEQNLLAYPEFHVRAERWDVLSSEASRVAPSSLDFIASNPPYIRTGQLSSLQPEVQKEPSLALDGGEDGLRFYRAILEHWLGCLRPGGVLGTEIGEDQGPQVAALFESRGLRNIRVVRDWAGLDRAVLGETVPV